MIDQLTKYVGGVYLSSPGDNNCARSTHLEDNTEDGWAHHCQLKSLLVVETEVGMTGEYTSSAHQCVSGAVLVIVGFDITRLLWPPIFGEKKGKKKDLGHRSAREDGRSTRQCLALCRTNTATIPLLPPAAYVRRPSAVRKNCPGPNCQERSTGYPAGKGKDWTALKAAQQAARSRSLENNLWYEAGGSCKEKCI
ncbi:hypothetical protein B0T17DRAFT_601377 [Bombardia bombarda]|uniref:Uncharacterized protein n=1 Tax=Bombardia bombarda TaxID=252184 RepID=A0AA39WN41_9PEZI|nr:hypothetical protein B0T17DRAFT_601377 [Bombardia bombarda]